MIVEMATVVVQICRDCARLCADCDMIEHGCALVVAHVHAHDAFKGKPHVVRSVDPCLGYPGAPPYVL